MFDREDSMSECVLSPDLCWAEGWPCWGFGWSALSGHGSPSCWCSQKPPVLVVGEMGCTGMQTWNQNTHTHTQIHHWFLILRLVPRRKAPILLKIKNISNVRYLHNFVIYMIILQPSTHKNWCPEKSDIKLSLNGALNII